MNSWNYQKEAESSAALLETCVIVIDFWMWPISKSTPLDDWPPTCTLVLVMHLGYAPVFSLSFARWLSSRRCMKESARKLSAEDFAAAAAAAAFGLLFLRDASGEVFVSGIRFESFLCQRRRDCKIVKMFVWQMYSLLNEAMAGIELHMTPIAASTKLLSPGNSVRC